MHKELDDAELDDLGELIDLMLVEGERPREIMKVLMENGDQFDKVLERTFRFGRILQLDFICKCTDSQMRLIAKQIDQLRSSAFDGGFMGYICQLCVWQILQSGLPVSVKNMFAKKQTTSGNKYRHPWGKGSLSEELERFETQMLMCKSPADWQHILEFLPRDVVLSSLWLARVFQDDFFFAQTDKGQEWLLRTSRHVPHSIVLPFYAQLMERGNSEMRTRISIFVQTMIVNGLNVWAITNADLYLGKYDVHPWGSEIDYRCNDRCDEPFNRSRYAKSRRYRQYFYGAVWMDQAVTDAKLPGWEYLRIRGLGGYCVRKHKSIVGRDAELLESSSYPEFEIKCMVSGRRLTKALTDELVSRTCNNNPFSTEILAGLLENKFADMERLHPIDMMVLRLACSECEADRWRRVAEIVERNAPGLISGFRDCYGGTIMDYVLGDRINAWARGRGDESMLSFLRDLGCDFSLPGPNGASLADKMAWHREAFRLENQALKTLLD